MHAQYFQEPNEIQFGQKHQLNQKSTHKCDRKRKCPKYIKRLTSTHDWRYHFEIKIKWKQDTNWWKCHQGVNQTLYTFHTSTRYQDEMFVFQRDMSSGKSQLKTTNVQKHIVASPICVHYLWSCIWIQMHTNWIITHHVLFKH